MNMYKKLIMGLVILSSFMNSSIMSGDLQYLIDETAYRLDFIYDTENQLGKNTNRDFSTEAKQLISNLLACSNRNINKKDEQLCNNGFVKIGELYLVASNLGRDGKMVQDWIQELRDDALAGNLLKK
jgi:hypothetical protein